MKKSNTSFIITVFLFTFIIVIFVKKQKANLIAESYIEKVENSHVLIEEQEEQINTLLNSIVFSYNTNGKKLEPTLVVNTENSDSVLIKDLIGNSKKLIFRYSEIHCDVCIDSEISLLKEMSDSIGKDNVLILAYYDSFRNMSTFRRLNQISIPVYNIKNLRLEIEEINVPYYFVIDSSLELKNVMIPSKYYPEVTSSYLNFIENQFHAHQKMW